MKRKSTKANIGIANNTNTEKEINEGQYWGWKRHKRIDRGRSPFFPHSHERRGNGKIISNSSPIDEFRRWCLSSWWSWSMLPWAAPTRHRQILNESTNQYLPCLELKRKGGLGKNTEQKCQANNKAIAKNFAKNCKQATVYSSNDVLLLKALGSFSNDDGDGNQDVKKAIGLLRKTTPLHVHHAFLYSSLPSLHGYDVKMPNCKFYRGRKQATTNLFFSL